MKNPETNPFSLIINSISKHYTGVIACVLVATSCYIWIKGGTVPNALENLTFIVVSFLFGQKTANIKDLNKQNKTE